MKIDCCLECEKRYPGCHADCNEYKRQKAAWDKQQEKIAKEKEKSCPDLFDRLKYWR